MFILSEEIAKKEHFKISIKKKLIQLLFLKSILRNFKRIPNIGLHTKY